MDKFSLKDLVKEEIETPAPKTTLWEPISVETKEPVNEFSSKTSRIGSLSDLNEDLKETKTVVKSGWTPIVQKVEEKPVNVLPSAKPSSGFKGLKDVYKEELINVVNASPTVIYERIELPPVVEYKKSAEEERDELVQSFTEQIKVKEQNRVNEPARVEPVQEPEPVTEEAVAEPITEEAPKEKTLIDKASEFITKELKIEENSYQQPDAQPSAQNFKDITRKVKHLEDWLSKVSLAGPGGGETNLRYLDDVDRDSIVDGYVLSYDEVTSKFTFVSPTAGSFTPTDVTQVFAEVKNADSVTITKGQPVYLFAAVGNRASVKLANNSGDATSAKTLGLVYSSSIAPGDTGLIITQGVISGVDTQAYNEGDTLYLGNTAGTLTAVKPYAPEHLVYIGVVERANQGQGQIYVRPQNGYELNEIHDVSINHTVPLSNNDILVWNTASNLWINRPVSYLNQTTSNIIEGTNLYYSNSRVYSNVISLGYITSSSLTGYATNAQLSSYATTSNLTLKANVVDLTTANVIELNNLYFTNARAVAAVEKTTLQSLNVSGNVHIFSNLQVDGNINFTGNVTQIQVTGNSGVFLGDVNGYGALYAGLSSYTPLPSTVIQATAHSNAYSQINFQNLDNGTEASAEYVITADNGTDTTNYVDMGIASSNWTGTQSNSLGDAVSPNDAWVYVQGGTGGGNLILGATTTGKSVRVVSGGAGKNNVIAVFNAANIDAASNTTGSLTVNGGIGVRGNVYANYYKGNGSTLTGITSLANDSYALTLKSDGKVNITGNVFNTGTSPATLWSTDSVTNYWRSPTGGGPGQPLNSYVRVNSSGATITLDTGVLGFGSSISWLYDHAGNLTFPDSTVQTTAFNNTAVYANVITLGYITSSALSGYAKTANLTTANVTELTNLYYTNARVYANVISLGYAKTANLTTANVTELTNLYFTNARVYSNVTSLGYITSSALSGYATNAQLATYATNTQLATYATNAQLTSYATITNVALKANIVDLTTANVTELTNLYFTNARVVSALSTNTLGNVTTGNIVVAGSGNYNGIEVNSTYGGVSITNDRGNMLIGNNARDGVARYALNTIPGKYSGVQVQRAGTEKWFYGASLTEDFVVRADGATDILTINANGTITVTGSITGYVTNAQLATYATNAQLATYATNAQLTSYATTTNVALKANIVDLTTANVTELTNLYFTNARSYANVLTLGYAKTANLTTANVTELTNLYFTNARATAAVTNTSLSNITVGGFANVVYTPVSTSGVALNITAANTKGGTGYADFLQVTNTSGGAVSPTKWLRLNNTGELQIINSGYTAQLLVLSDSGDLTVLGNITSSGNKSGYSSGRPGFRVIGSGSTSWSTTVNTGGYFNSSQFTTDYNQGSYLNTTTGVFTAPVAGLYQIYIVGRNAGNASISQLAVVKNASGGNGSGGTVACMIEFGGSSSMNHTGAGTILQLAVNDTLALKVLAGTIQFDSNDNWSIAYIG